MIKRTDRHQSRSTKRLRNVLALALMGITTAATAQEPVQHPVTGQRIAGSSIASYAHLQQVNQTIDGELDSPESVQFDAGWWQQLVSQPIRAEEPKLQLSLESTLVRALENSKQVKVFSELPLIRETAIIEADAAFDWVAYMDGRWDDTNDPIGNSLTAGPGLRYFEDHRLTGRAGLRRRTRNGGQLDINQQLGHQRNNSTFFVPNPQGTARLNVSFTQPLWRGRGEVYNTSLVLLAQIDKKVADDEFNRQLQSHLLEVARSYWSLYLERAVLYQKINSYVRGKEVFDRLNSRRDIDAQASQIISAEASLKQRVSELVRARAAVKNAESRLRSLVNDNALMNNELIPIDQPTFESLPVDMLQSVSVAFQMRPELHQALKNIKAASVRLRMAKHELLPVLNLVTDAYLSGLAADGDVVEAFGNEFADGRPSYGIGLQYELPVCNRAAEARHRRRQLEIRQLRNQYSTTLETVRLEVEVAVREFQTSQTELSTKLQAMNARAAQLDALTRRWEQLPGEDVAASLALENLLLAQDRLAQSEFEYLQSQLTFKLSIFNLKRAMGTLLKNESVNIGRTSECGVPLHVVDKALGHTAQQNYPQQSFQVSPSGIEVMPGEVAMPVGEMPMGDVAMPQAEVYTPDVSMPEVRVAHPESLPAQKIAPEVQDLLPPPVDVAPLPGPQP